MSKKISELPDLNSPSSGDYIPVVQGTNTYKARLRNIKELFSNDPGLNRFVAISGDLIVSGSVYATGDLKVSGNSQLGKSQFSLITVIGSQNNSGNLIVSGSINSTGRLAASGDVMLGKDSSSLITISGVIKSAGGVHSHGDFAVVGNSKLSGNLTVTGSGMFGTPGRSSISHWFEGLTTVNQTGIFRSGITSLGVMSGASNLGVGGNLLVQGILGASGDAVIGQSSSNTLTVKATSIYQSPSIFQQPLNVQSNVGIQDNLRVSGNTFLGNEIQDTVYINAKTIMNGGVEVSGGILITGNTVLSGNLLANQSGFFRTGVNIGGDLFVTGRTFLGKSIDNNTHIQGSGFVSGHFTVRGGLNVSGLILAPLGIQDNTTKKCMFNPQARLGIANGMFFDSGIGVNKIKYLFYRNGHQADRVAWENTTGDFQANDIVYCSGIYTDTIVNHLDRYHSAYQGFFIVDSVYSNATDGGLILRPTGLPISPPTSSGNLVSSVPPSILCHYRSGWLNGVSGIIPFRGSSSLSSENSNYLGSDQLHHRIIFNNSFDSPDFMVTLTCNQGSGQKGTDWGEAVTLHNKIVNVSYFDKNLNNEKIIFAGNSIADDDPTDGSLDTLTIGEFLGTSPTRVWAKFEPI